MSFLKNLFGFEEPEEAPKEPFKIDPDAFYMWEDNYLMLELLPKENLDFLKRETERIDDFAKENYNGLGYNMVTPVGNNDVKTVDKLIDIDSVLSIVNESSLKMIEKVGHFDVGLLEGNDRPFAYGNKDYALLFDEKSGVLNNIWLEGDIKNNNESEIMELTNVLYTLGQIFDFVAVNWHASIYFDLSNKDEAENFVRTSLLLSKD